MIERIVKLEGGTARWTSFMDSQTEKFERDLEARGVGLPLQQRHVWLRSSRRELRLLQGRDATGMPSFQAAVTLTRPRVGFVAIAVAANLGQPARVEDEGRVVQLLKELLHSERDVVSLRLQPHRESIVGLRDFEARARRAGFELCEPLSVTRTLLLDLSPDPEAILARLPKKRRAHVRARETAPVLIRSVSAPAFQAQCEPALVAALERTGRLAPTVDLSTDFAVARERPDLVEILGLSLVDQPERLLAFVIGHRHGTTAEYSAAGSLFDPTLRKLPFNYFLLWELMLWARRSGATVFDMGGVTDGGEDDPLAGISSFKRHFTTDEAEVGREMISTLRPMRRWTYDTLHTFRDQLRPLARLRQ